MRVNGGIHHGRTTCGWRRSSRSSCKLYLRSRMLENRARGLCASFVRLAPQPALGTAMSSCIRVVLMRSVVSRAVCSTCCSTGSRFAPTSTAAPAVVQDALVIVCAARLCIFRIALIIELPLLVYPVPGICHADHPYSIWSIIITRYTCRRLTSPVPKLMMPRRKKPTAVSWLPLRLSH